MTSQEYVFIMFENAPLDEDTVRQGLDILFLLHEEFKNVTTDVIYICTWENLIDSDSTSYNLDRPNIKSY